METEYLSFAERPEQGRKTMTWMVVSRSSGSVLGRIRWYGAWRQFCFYPEGNTIWNTGCLADVQSFIRVQMELRKK